MAIGRRYQLQIFLVSLATLLIEISYTRIISFKLFYFFTYLVIGLALLGLGAGGVMMAVSRRLQRVATERIVVLCALAGAAAVPAGYLVVAVIGLDTLSFWDYGVSTVTVGLWLLVLCLAMFGSFLPAGIVLATLFSRRPEEIGRLYFADLLGAGLACLIVIPLLERAGPPATLMLGALSFSACALVTTAPTWRGSLPPTAAAAALAAISVAGFLAPETVLPDVRRDHGKTLPNETELVYSSWSPLFRVDVRELGLARLLFHDGLAGSLMRHWNGEEGSLARFGYDRTRQRIPFAVKDEPPRNVAIIGAAAGNEVQASLYYEAGHVDAVEINPVTYRLVTDEMASYVGNLADHPSVDYHMADGRTFMARSDDRYDLIWLPAPDSYSATNASTASAFVLTESYLYTSDAITDYLEHLAPGGLLVAQFGEQRYNEMPNRTARYVATARAALEGSGIEDVRGHFLVSSAPPVAGFPGVSTIVVKAEPFTPAEISQFSDVVPEAPPGSRVTYFPGYQGARNAVNWSIELSGRQLEAFRDHYPFAIGPVDDDRPFFWHFTPYDKVAGEYLDPIDQGFAEVAVGERTLLLLLVIAVLLAAAFLLLPFVRIRETWRLLPRKGTSFAYFSAIGLGFIVLEIALIQRLVLFLGYPTYSITVTLASLLIFLGAGSVLSGRLTSLSPWPRWLPAALGTLGGLYLFTLEPLTDALLGLPLLARVVVAFALLAPLGVCLGMFMPLGVRAVAAMTDSAAEYVAWAWAVNGFATVVGSVVATILAMSYGFQVVMYTALALYLGAMVALRRLESPLRASAPAGHGPNLAAPVAARASAS